jgi:hypothetical protein
VEKYSLIPRSISVARRRFAPLVVFFLLAALLTQANVPAAGGNAPTPPTPPSEKLLAEWGQWETEYWSDSGGLSFRYVGDPAPSLQPAAGQGLPDFVIGAPTLLTAIIDVHVNPNTDAIHVTDTGSPGSLALVDDVGNQYGPFATERGGVAVNNGKADATILWVALVEHVELPAGRYWVQDSDPSSLLVNAQTFNVGATLVKGVDASAYEKYMDALVAANEPEIVEKPAPGDSGVSSDTGGKEPARSTYSNPLPVVNNPPGSDLVSFPANNPSFPCEFVTDKPLMVTKIMDYHINDGKGAAPGLIGLQEHGGTWYGSWHAYGQTYGGIPNAIWVVTPNFEIPAGSYKVMDNEGSTLSADADNRAMCVVKISPSITSPIDNVTGKYTIDFMGDDGISIDYPLVVAILDHKKNLEIGVIIEGQPLKFNATVTERANGSVKANFGAGFSDISFSVPMTFTKKAESYALMGAVNVLGDQGGAIAFSGSRTSTDLPGYVPPPAAGLGKVGSIPGPASAGQAAAGIAFPTLVTLLAAAAASAGRGGGSAAGSYAGASGGDDSGGGTATDTGTDTGADTGGMDTGGAYSGTSPDSGIDTGNPDSGATGTDTGGAYSGASPDSTIVTGSPDSRATGIDTGGMTTGSQVQGQAPSPAVSPPQTGHQDGESMTVHDFGDGLDKTYYYHADSGEWVNPLTGGMYVAANYAASAQAHAETGAETTKRAETDASALADGPARWLDDSSAGGAGSADVTIVRGSIPVVSPASGIPAAAAGAATVTGAPAGSDPASLYPPASANASGTASLADSTSAGKPDPVLNAYQKGLIGLKADMEVIDKSLKDQNIYVKNKFQGDPSLVVDGLTKAANTAWDYTAGWVTGSTGLTCDGYVVKTMEGVKASVAKQFPGATVERAIFLEKSTYQPEGVLDYLDSVNDDNHTFLKVTLPSGEKLAVDFHGANSSNFKTNPPVVRPYEDVRNEWKTYMGDEFMEF